MRMPVTHLLFLCPVCMCHSVLPTISFSNIEVNMSLASTNNTFIFKRATIARSIDTVPQHIIVTPKMYVIRQTKQAKNLCVTTECGSTNAERTLLLNVCIRNGCATIIDVAAICLSLPLAHCQDNAYNHQCSLYLRLFYSNARWLFTAYHRLSIVPNEFWIQTRIETHFYSLIRVHAPLRLDGFLPDFMLPTVKNIWQQFDDKIEKPIFWIKLKTDTLAQWNTVIQC